MFGRAGELHSILDLLSDPSVRLVTLTGRAGVGKSRLAFEVARKLHDEGLRPVSFISLASVHAVDMVYPEIASQLGLGDLSDGGPARIAQRLRGQAHLLVLDNFEHVLGAAGTLIDLLEACDQLQVLTTSQSPLRLRIERIVRIASLPLPELTGTDLGEFASQPAVSLYCDRARAVDDHFRLEDDNAGAVAALCRELEGLPLAIELAAARAVTLSAAEVTPLIAHRRLDVLHAPRVDAPERHHDLRSALDWTYQLLASPERDLLLRLSVVGGAFDMDDVEALSRSDPTLSLDALSELVDVHLVEPVPETDGLRFELLPSIGEFAGEKLDASGERVEAQKRFVRWMARRARSAAVGLDAPDPDSWWRWIHDAEPALVQAVRQCGQLGMDEEACDLLAALAPLWDSSSFAPAHRQLMDEVITRADGQRIATATYCDLILWSALLLVRRLETDDRQVGLQRLERGCELAEVLGDDRLRLRGRYFEALVGPMTGELERAVEKNVEGMKLARDAGSDLWTARFEVRLGMGAELNADHRQALVWGISALDTAIRLGDGRTRLLAAVLLSPLVREHPELARSLPSPEELRRLARSIHQTRIEISLVSSLAIEAAFSGDLQRAARYGFDSLSLSGGEEFSFSSAYGLVVTVRLAATLGKKELAARIHGRIGDGVTAAMPRSYRDDYLATVESLRRDLSTVVYDQELSAGSTSPWSSIVSEAQEYLRNVMAKEQGGSSPEERFGNRSRLTERQLEVVDLLARGLTNQEIGDQLGVTSKTVMHHTGAIYARLGVRGRSEAVAWAVRQGRAADSTPQSS
jgi:predicted ATPase/DNA-binding CsgD family transcriptional regulator